MPVRKPILGSHQSSYMLRILIDGILFGRIKIHVESITVIHLNPSKQVNIQ